MNAIKLTLVAIGAMALAACSIGKAVAQEIATGLPKELGDLAFNYEVRLAEMLKPIEELKAAYIRQLKAVATRVQAKGDLPGLLAVQAEIESITKSGVPAKPDPKYPEPTELLESRKIFQRTSADLVDRQGTKIEPLRAGYRRELEKLKIDFTRAGRLEDALSAKRLIDSLETGASTNRAEPGKTNLKIRVQVDDVSYLYLRGPKIWFDHTRGKFSPPGLAGGEFPTYLDDKTEWKPVWNGKVTEPYDAGISLPTTGDGIEIHLRFSDGRGQANVIQNPGPDNDYTAIIELLDQRENRIGIGGADWMEFRLSW
ncbi:MAG: hypothetical protein KDN19_14625 [Verrucomicrobiae bacterium]|nr:hypothetical protein [Verrucomicrobiae bacterium]